MRALQLGAPGVLADDRHFEVKTILPGRYRAMLFANPKMLQSEEFDVGPNGASDLVLHMKDRESSR